MGVLNIVYDRKSRGPVTLDKNCSKKTNTVIFHSLSPSISLLWQAARANFSHNELFPSSKSKPKLWHQMESVWSVLTSYPSNYGCLKLNMNCLYGTRIQDRRSAYVLHVYKTQKNPEPDRYPILPVGWNWTNSKSWQGKPALVTMAVPSPVLVWADVQLK